MSSVTMWERPTIHIMLAHVRAAKSAVRPPHRRSAVEYTRITVAKPQSPTQSRATNSDSPNALNSKAVAQYCSGGFSKYFRPFRRGVTQSPVEAISREISE